mmetsp:Transcript_33301/g.61912  ORF Transcript_33301/g.61912 Transcript_33301/m.61912 type:complete len:208 (-) Transcript_33301:495-1118(-)
MVLVHEGLELLLGADRVHALARVAVRVLYDGAPAHAFNPNGHLLLAHVSDRYRRTHREAMLPVLVVPKLVGFVSTHLVAPSREAADDRIEDKRLRRGAWNARPWLLGNITIGCSDGNPMHVLVAYEELPTTDLGRRVRIVIFPLGDVDLLLRDICQSCGVPRIFHVVLIINYRKGSGSLETLDLRPECVHEKLVVVAVFLDAVGHER